MIANERLLGLLFSVCERLDEALHERSWKHFPFRRTICCLADVGYGVPAYVDDPRLARWAANHSGRGRMEHLGP